MAEPHRLDRLPVVTPLQMAPAVLETRGLSVRAGDRTLLRAVDFRLPVRGVVAIVGPSGAGKTTLLRSLNRMVDLVPGLRRSGEVRFHGNSIWNLDPDLLRARIGMVFQTPVVFPCSIAANVLFGVRHLPHSARPPRASWPDVVERALGEAGLWAEVADRLDEPAVLLSAGQRQRLCLARTLAVGPEVLLMDEPTSALDPRATEVIEELILRLKEKLPIALVTHNLAQARRVADEVACLCLRAGAGELLETACCDEVFSSPRCVEVAEFLRGELA